MAEKLKNFLDKFDTILLLIGACFLTVVYMESKDPNLWSLVMLVWGGFLAATNQERGQKKP